MNKQKLSMITLFSGTGMQERGFQNSNLFDLDIIGTSEIDADATLSYAAIHCGLTPEMIKEYDFPDVKKMAEYLTERKVGWDFQKNKGRDWFTYTKGKKLEDLKKYYLASVLQNNYGDISSIKELPYADFWFYSSCCQDLSVAGKMQGMKKGSGTRSGLLWEVERLLEIAVETGTQPKYLCLENVKNMVGKQFKPDFDLWILRLEELGYNTYYEVLNAKECGCPQNRQRIFALSIRKDIDNGTFTFPIPFDNGLRLKDILEKDVEEKYYINTDKASNLIQQLIDKGQLKGQRYNDSQSILVKNQATEYTKTIDTANTLMARDWKGFGNQDMVAIVESDTLDSSNRLGGLWDGETRHQAGSVWDVNGMSPTLDTAQGGGRMPHIVENNTKPIWKPLGKTQYMVSNFGSVADTSTKQKVMPFEENGELKVKLNINGVERVSTVQALVDKLFANTESNTYKPICVGNTTPSGKSQCNAVYSTDGVSQTLCAGTHGYATGSILEETNKINVVGNYMPSNHDASRIVDTDYIAPCVKENHGTVTGILETQKLSNIKTMYRIRKLTPSECWVLMGLTKEDCMKATNLGISNSALYKIAGNGIVTNCIELIAEHLYKAQYDSTYICTDEQPIHNIKQKHAEKDVIIYDDYNNRIKADQNNMGTITTNIGNDALRNGIKLIEVNFPKPQVD